MFDIRDVDSITGLGVSTKLDDKTNIGKFGVGFKSVFSITNTPEILSGEFHFAIDRLFIPRILGPVNSATTRFLFPFNNSNKKPERAVSEIDRELRNLGSETLLFLNEIEKIEYLLSDGETLGYIARSEESDGMIKIKVSTPGVGDVESYWLRYEKNVPVLDENSTSVSCTVSIAFRVSKTMKDGKDSGWRIEAINPKPGNVFIVFPALKENSGLRFYVNAPFASTVGRDGVRACKENDALCVALADLVSESLLDIKNRGLLTMDFLAVMPNIQDEIDAQYEPIRKAVINAFQNESLVPTKSGSYAPAGSLYYGPARISEVFSDADLSYLTGHSVPLWAKNPQQLNSREDRFLKSLKINAWSYSELEWDFCACDDDDVSKLENWIEKKSDSWLMRLYALLDYAISEWDKGINKDLRLVRTICGQHEKAEGVYFMPEKTKGLPKKLNFVKPETIDAGNIAQHKRAARSFLAWLGVKEYTEEEKQKKQLEVLANKYASAAPKVTVGQHFKDIERFVEFDGSEHLLRGKFFVLDEANNYCKPDLVCLPIIDALIEEANIRSVYNKNCISCQYEKLDDNFYSNFFSIVENLGAMTELRIILDEEYNTRDYTLPGIEKIMAILPKSENKVLFAKLIWDAVQHCNIWDARYLATRPDGRHRFQTQYNTMTTIFKQLSENAWVPNKNGHLHTPENITVEMLPNNFVLKNGGSHLFSSLNFGKAVREAKKQAEAKSIERQRELQRRAEALSVLGVEAPEIEALKMLKEEGLNIEEISKAAISESRKAKQPAFPKNTVKNPKRRAAKVTADYADADSITYTVRNRSVRTTLSSIDPRTMLRSEYTNEDGEMVCQICQEEMPFKGRDGKYYFEAVEVFEINKESACNYLALCPLCAAKFKEFVKRDSSAWRNLTDAFRENSGVEIPVFLDIETCIRFTESHMFDLRTILAEDDRLPRTQRILPHTN